MAISARPSCTRPSRPYYPTRLYIQLLKYPHIYIVINPKIFYSSFHFSLQPYTSHFTLRPSLISSAHHSHSLTISLTLNLTAGPTAQPLTASPSSQCRPKLSQLSHSLSHTTASPSSSLSSLTHTATSPQVVKHRHNSLLSQLYFIIAVADLALSHNPLHISSSSLMASQPHDLTPPRSPFFFFFSFFFFGFSSSQSCEFVIVFVFVILKGKIINHKS